MLVETPQLASHGNGIVHHSLKHLASVVEPIGSCGPKFPTPAGEGVLGSKIWWELSDIQGLGPQVGEMGQVSGSGTASSDGCRPTAGLSNMSRLNSLSVKNISSGIIVSNGDLQRDISNRRLARRVSTGGRLDLAYILMFIPFPPISSQQGCRQ